MCFVCFVGVCSLFDEKQIESVVMVQQILDGKCKMCLCLCFSPQKTFAKFNTELLDELMSPYCGNTFSNYSGQNLSKFDFWAQSIGCVSNQIRVTCRLASLCNNGSLRQTHLLFLHGGWRGWEWHVRMCVANTKGSGMEWGAAQCPWLSLQTGANGVRLTSSTEIQLNSKPMEFVIIIIIIL